MNLQFLVFFASFGFSFAEITQLEVDEFIDEFFEEGTSVPLERHLVQEFLEKYEEVKDLGDGAITAIVNKYADKLFNNIETYAVGHGLDPILLADFNQKFLTASVTLRNGTLKGISSLTRNGDVEISYSHTGRQVSIEIPVNLKNLNFTYKFHVVLVLIGPSGKLTGKIKNFDINLKLHFDFNTMNATLEKITSPGMGAIELTFDGNGIVASVMNILSKFVTAILHPFLEGFIKQIMRLVAGGIVKTINKDINHFLHPNGTNFTIY